MNVVSAVTGAGFALASRVRGTKVFHPHGFVHEATVALDGSPHAPGFLGGKGTHPALVRFSRGAGFPEPLPDFFGMAIRLVDVHGPDRHQDFLLITSGNGFGVQHLLLPAPDFMRLPYSSVLPYRAGADVFTVGAKAPVRSGDVAPGQRWQLATAPLTGRLRRAGEVRLGPRLAPEANTIRFNPWNTGGGIQPAGPFQKLRDSAYPGSQVGWSGAEPENLSV